jgi:DNA replication protein DnaC
MTQPSSAEPMPQFQPPPEPAPRICACGAVIRADYLKPMFAKGALVAGGRWIDADDACQKCRSDAQEHEVEVQRGARLAQLLGRAGFAPRHHDMTLASLRSANLSQALRDAMHDARHTGRNLFLFGQPGRGKTHAAAALLRSHLETTLKPGYLRIVPELMVELRKAIVTHRVEAVLDQLSNASALVLDDLGSENDTDYALEKIYLLIDRWWNGKKKNLWITSNLTPGEISERLDPRIASRIVGMCRVVEVSGEDWRLKQAEGGA